MDFTITHMFIMDLLVCILSMAYMKSAFSFVLKARKNYKKHQSDLISSEHFNDHFGAAIVGMTGGVICIVSSILHLIEQNIIHAPESVINQIEYGMDIGIVILMFSGIQFMIHMANEETPGHPFYIQEYTIPHKSCFKKTTKRSS